MAGRVVVSTLNNDTGILATQNGMTGIAKAWVNFNGTGTVAIRASFNVSSITDNGTGNYSINFTTAMPDTNYVVIAGGWDGATPRTIYTKPDTTTRALANYYSSGSTFDDSIAQIAIFSS
jgi:hypothetical protein